MGTNDVSGLLRRHALRATPQRRAILEAFRRVPHEHLTAEEVLSRAGVAVPGIGRGTVYAALAELAEIGLLQSVGDPQPIRYETNLEPHDHFGCRLCLRLFDVELGGRTLKRSTLPGYRIEAVSVRAEGVCSDCHDYQRGLTDGAGEVRSLPLLRADDLEELSCRLLDSPIGDLALAASASGIVRVAFSDHADFTLLAARASRPRGPAAARARVLALERSLTDYLMGTQSPIADEIDWRLVSDVEAGLLNEVQGIPWGTGRPYDRLRDDLPVYARGFLFGRNPVALIVPCHRVRCGTLRPDAYVGGAERLHFLHQLEDR